MPWTTSRARTRPDLTAVKAKIGQGLQGALADLRDLAQDTQQADVYNLLGFTLRKTGDYKTALTYYTKALELSPTTRPPANIWANSMSRLATWTRPRSSWHR